MGRWGFGRWGFRRWDGVDGMGDGIKLDINKLSKAHQIAVVNAQRIYVAKTTQN